MFGQELGNLWKFWKLEQASGKLTLLKHNLASLTYQNGIQLGNCPVFACQETSEVRTIDKF